MRDIVFPPVDSADPDGVVAIGGDFEIDMLVSAYSQGIFPWPVSKQYPRVWFSPDPRGIINLEKLHISKSFRKFLRTTNLRVSFNQNFAEVIELCGSIARKDQPSSWITEELKDAYINLFNQELAYSVEIWNSANRLVGGLYGVCIGQFVSGESMFMIEDNASKLALYSLCTHLKEKGIEFLDTQMITNVVESFGGEYIPREHFLNKIKKLNWYQGRSEIFP